MTKTKFLISTLFFFSFLVFAAPLHATIYTIGTGSATLNQEGVTPFSTLYEDNRSQYLYTAAELTAAGATAGPITSLGFNFITLGGIAAENVNIKMGMTTNAGLTGITEGLVVVYSSLSVTQVTGWNTYTFSAPFVWDGVSNLIVEVCRDNNDYNNNYGVQGQQFPAGTFYTFAYYDDYAVGCNMTSGYDLTNPNRRRRPNIQFDIAPGTPCDATPVAGLSASVTTVCPATPFSLTATPSFSIGISFQYQASTDMGVTWTNLGGSTSSSSYPVSDQPTATQYRVIVSCTGHGADTSAAVTVDQSPFTSCYCIPTYSDGCAYDDNIENFILAGDAGTGINHIGSGCSPAGYGDFTSMSVTMTPGTSYAGTLSSSFPGSDEAYAIWVDWNNNGVFESAEIVASGTSVGGTYLGYFTITPPLTATPGNHRMRVRLEYDWFSGPPTDACSMGEYGETHDYTILIAGGCTDPIVSLGSDINGCTGSALLLDAGNPGLSFIWSTGDTTQTVTVTTSGSYSVTVTDGACAASDTIGVTFNTPPVVNLGVDTVICSGETLVLNAANPGATYIWNTGDATQTIVVTDAGIYSVTVNSGACSSSDTITVAETAAPVAAAISVVDNMPEFEFSAPGTTGAATYAWDFGDGTTASTEIASHTYTANGVFTVTLVVTNDCGQTGSVTTTVNVSGVGVGTVTGKVSNVQVYPNPAKGLTVVEAKDATIQSIEVVDNLGRVIQRTQPNTGKTVIDLKGMAQGIYTLRIQTTKGNSTQKLVVKD